MLVKEYIDSKIENRSTIIEISHERICKCPPTHLNCMDPKEWLKSQLGVWQFTYEKRDIRDKSLHPATFPLNL